MTKLSENSIYINEKKIIRYFSRFLKSLNLPTFLLQSGSTIFLACSLLTFPSDVDPIFFYGCVANFVVSFWFHGLQRPCPCPIIKIEKRESSTAITTTITSSCWWNHYSTMNDAFLWPDFVLRRIDRLFVAFICLYTGMVCDDGSTVAAATSSIIPLPLIVFILSGTAGYKGNWYHISAIGYALYLTLFRSGGFSSSSSGDKNNLPLLPLEWRLAFIIASFVGVLVFILTQRIGAWWTPYRYTWHLACGIITATASRLHHAKSSSMMQS